MSQQDMIDYLEQNDEIKFENEDLLIEIHGENHYIDQENWSYMSDCGEGFMDAADAIEWAVREFGGIHLIESYGQCHN